MRSSKPRSRSKQNRNRSVGNVVNRVFDSSGPEGKVRGTPQQVIEKYNQLARDAQLSNDRVAAENFQQHAEHYLRLLSEAQREQDARREQQERENRERQAERDRERQERQEDASQTMSESSSFSTAAHEEEQLEVSSMPIMDEDAGLAPPFQPEQPNETQAPKPARKTRVPRKPRAPKPAPTENALPEVD
ncbi:MAG TPA: DUF4167 domain-containing protein [Rhodobacteraceae bacterium]|jgi:hypothetical protein|nr:DUF4167 domain-containing protein [Paracoccaceae bacterium]